MHTINFNFFFSLDYSQSGNTNNGVYKKSQDSLNSSAKSCKVLQDNAEELMEIVTPRKNVNSEKASRHDKDGQSAQPLLGTNDHNKISITRTSSDKLN